jgi:hypothetical protein
VILPKPLLSYDLQKVHGLLWVGVMLVHASSEASTSKESGRLLAARLAARAPAPALVNQTMVGRNEGINW